MMNLTKNNPLHTSMLPPAQLWIGSSDLLIATTKEWLQQFFCTQAGCAVCVSCRAIADEHYHACMWLRPENSYTLPDLEPIFSTLSFALQKNEDYFFIITQADLLTPACSNALLKSLEEPPPGYHFMMLAQREDAILPTIRSRCITKTFYAPSHTGKHPLFTLFSSLQPLQPLNFLKELEQLKIQEQETFELIDQLLIFWMAEHKRAVIAGQPVEYKKADHMIMLLKAALLKPPMPGSSSLFWKNLALQVNYN